MRRASAINLALLGGGLTLFGAAGVLSEHNRRVACEARRGHPPAGAPDECARAPGSAYGGGHGGYGSSGRGGGFFGIARGGFGGHGAGHGGGA